MKKVNTSIRTRYAPSPTGFMHVGNLRTALYEYLIAKSAGGKFVLRIEDTDRERLIAGAVDVIYRTLKEVGLKHDEGPDIGGEHGPYMQSERLEIYGSYAQKLVQKGEAYYCFCSKERLDKLRESNQKKGEFSGGYDGHCREQDEREVDRLLKSGVPYVIRQKVPRKGTIAFEDAVYGRIVVDSSELDDQILIKSDKYPTYNFANVIDDHEMAITHVVRGCEYLSSTPKYNLLYEALGFKKPIYVHLPLIMGKNADGSTSKLSKRHGATGFEDLVKEGYLPEAIINYIALLGWCPRGNREIYTLEELVGAFHIEGIGKSPAVFDYDKLSWMNGEYIRAKSAEEFIELAQVHLSETIKKRGFDLRKLAGILQQRVTVLTQIPDMVKFFEALPEYEVDIYINKKSKTTLKNSKEVLESAIGALENLGDWSHDGIHITFAKIAESKQLKNGTVMWPVRIGVSGQTVTPGGAIEIVEILGKEETIRRIKIGVEKLSKALN